ncbi:MAG TPA: HNH endonuclease signature motif containing protein [Bacteriovoracaceae bacterium]|nr:HNH endonuclease signature motif containing protein [Bacteriovoracaceae bacterium]
MNLKHLTDTTLHNDTIKLVRKEREITTEVLHHLRENDRRKLYSDHKCTSLFDYCVRILGYCESSAQRRIVASRLLQEIPELEKKIDDGLLSLSNISQVNQFFRENEVITKEEKVGILKEVEGLTKKECEKKLIQISGTEKPAREHTKRLSTSTSKVTIILTDETLAEVEKLKALMGRNLSMDELINFMAKNAIQKIEKEKFKQTNKVNSRSPEEVKRTPSASMKRDVYKRDQKCTQCGSLHRLNYDHREAFSLGGKTTTENLRLLCFNCNQRSRIRMKL